MEARDSDSNKHRGGRGGRGRGRRDKRADERGTNPSHFSSVISDCSSNADSEASYQSNRGRGRGRGGRRGNSSRGGHPGGNIENRQQERRAIPLQQETLDRLKEAKEAVSVALDSSIAKCLQEKQSRIQNLLAEIAKADVDCSHTVSQLVQKGSRAINQIEEAIDAKQYIQDKFFGLFLTHCDSMVSVDNEKLKWWLQKQGFSVDSLILFNPVESALTLLKEAEQSAGQKNFQLARDKFYQAQNLLRNCQEPATSQYVDSMVSFATAVQNAQQFADALKYYNAAFTIATSISPADTGLCSRIAYGKANCLKGLNNLQAASKEYETASQYCSQNGDSQFLSDIYNAKGHTDKQMGCMDAALEAFQKSFQVVHTNKQIRSQRHEEYADLLASSGNRHGALAEYESLLSVLGISLFYQQAIKRRVIEKIQALKSELNIKSSDLRTSWYNRIF